MNRRQLLKGIGATGLVGSVPAVQATPGEGDQDNGPASGEAPSEFVPTKAVSPGPFGVQTASTGEWIQYEFVFRNDMSCESLNEIVFEERDFRVGIADEVIEYDESDQYWLECRPTGDGQNVIGWRYTGKPLSPGEYDMFIEVRYNETVEVCRGDDCFEYEEGTVRTLRNTLQIEAGGNDSGNRNQG